MANRAPADPQVDNEAERLRQRYTTLPNAEAFSAPYNLARENNISRGRAAKILSTVEAYTLHRQFRRQKKKNPYLIYYRLVVVVVVVIAVILIHGYRVCFALSFRRQHCQVDLMDMQKLAAYNTVGRGANKRAYNHILVAVDAFSRKCWARKIFSKHATQTVPAMRSILDEMGRQPDQVRILSRQKMCVKLNSAH